MDEIVLPDQLPAYGITYCNQHRRDLEREDRFPRRVRLSPQRYGYLKAEIVAWVAERIAARDNPRAA